jgi:hypothetical protein
MWLQPDGALPHFGKVITAFLNKDYEGRWIGTGGPVAWPTRSPYLKSLHFFLWSCTQLTMYNGGKPEARHQLEATYEAAIDIRSILGCMHWQHSNAQ